MTLPNFFILGAPKCGTTSLTHWLSSHPNVFMPRLKEPHYFNTDDLHRNVTSSARYERLFRNTTRDQRAVGEASVWYLSSRHAIRNILQVCTEPKFLVMLRNPVDMAPALHQQNRYGLYEDVPGFEEAWQLQHLRQNGLSVPRRCRDPRHLDYGNACKLGRQVQQLIDAVGRNRLLFVFLEELGAHPRPEYLRILRFLDLPDDGRERFDVQNRSKMHRSEAVGRLIHLGYRAKLRIGLTKSFGIDRANVTSAPRQALSPHLVRELQDYFSEDVHLLGTLTGRDLAHWLEPSSPATAPRHQAVS